MSPVCFISVIDFLMSPALDTAHDGARVVFFLGGGGFWGGGFFQNNFKFLV